MRSFRPEYLEIARLLVKGDEEDREFRFFIPRSFSFDPRSHLLVYCCSHLYWSFAQCLPLYTSSNNAMRRTRLISPPKPCSKVGRRHIRYFYLVNCFDGKHGNGTGRIHNSAPPRSPENDSDGISRRLRSLASTVRRCNPRTRHRLRFCIAQYSIRC